MAYRANTLDKYIEIQNITLNEKKRGATQKWIYENIIKPRFFIGRSTFDRIMSINAKAAAHKLKQ